LGLLVLHARAVSAAVAAFAVSPLLPLPLLNVDVRQEKVLV